MTEIQQNRWDQLVRRSANVVGGGSQVNDTLNELFPVFDVENLPAELYRLGNITLGFGGGALVALAANSAIAQIFNPAGSGMLVTVTRIDIGFSTDTIVRWGTSAAQFGAAIATQTIRDLRDLPPRAPVAQITQTNSVGFATGTNQTRVLADVNFTLEPRNSIVILAPGTGFEIGSGALNLAFSYGFYWRERVAEASELNL